MDFEPSKESFLARLKTTDFNPSNLLTDAQALQEILWYLDEKRTGEIVPEILTPEKTSRTEAEQIITNLAKLYPLSRALVGKILSSLRKPAYPDGKELYRDAEFLDGFDVAKIMRDEIVKTFSDVENRVVHLTKEVQDYRNKLARLRQDKSALERQASALRDVAAERDKVQAEVNQLKIDTDENRLRQQINELNIEKNQLEAIKAYHQSQVEKSQKSIRTLKEELETLESQSNYSEEIKQIKSLFRKFPKDAEDAK